MRLNDCIGSCVKINLLLLWIMAERCLIEAVRGKLSRKVKNVWQQSERTPITRRSTEG